MAKRVLIIEDDDAVREELASALVDAGLLAELAVDGLDGLRRLDGGDVPSAILLDLRMPRLGGAEFLRRLRADPRYDAIPVITMTAGSERPGGDVRAHLRKPFDLADLLGIVLSLCELQPS